MADLSRHINEFIADVCAGKLNETPVTYRSKLRRLDQWMSERSLCITKLTATDIESFCRDLLQRALSPFTIRSCLMTARHFLKWAARRRITRGDLSTRITIPKMPIGLPKAIAAETVLSLLWAASATGSEWERSRNLALIYVLRDTGARIGGILNADIDDLDLRHRKLLVHTKGDRSQNLYLNIPTLAALREWLRHRPELHPQDRHLFISCKGLGLRRSSIYSLMERIRSKAGRSVQGRINPHAYRHAWARDALNAGEDITKVARTLGNSLRVTAEYYALWSDGEIQEAHARYSPGARLPIIKPKKE
jgi:site-specific recombinase XerD